MKNETFRTCPACNSSFSGVSCDSCEVYGADYDPRKHRGSLEQEDGQEETEAEPSASQIARDTLPGYSQGYACTSAADIVYNFRALKFNKGWEGCTMENLLIVCAPSTAEQIEGVLAEAGLFPAMIPAHQPLPGAALPTRDQLLAQACPICGALVSGLGNLYCYKHKPLRGDYFQGKKLTDVKEESRVAFSAPPSFYPLEPFDPFKIFIGPAFKLPAEPLPAYDENRASAGDGAL